MFDNYKNIPDSYVPCNTYNKKLINEKKYRQPFEEYDNQENFIGYGWRYGDSVVLEFTTEGEVTQEDFGIYETADAYMSGKIVTLTIYDFRYETVFTDKLEASTCVKFCIDEHTSERLVKGVYRCSLVLEDESGTGYQLVSPEDYVLVVK